jgi:hypothetical protein
LTPHSDNILMWSHYAENHRGVCLEFDASVRLFGSAMAVQYRKDYPSFTVNVQNADGVLQTILTKSDVWSYENEFRIVGAIRGNGLPIELDGDYLPIGDALVGVILGCDADEAKISKFFKGHSRATPLYRAVRSDDRYRLEIVPMAVAAAKHD